ncbi:pleckstrin homology-like domain family A member 2 [Sphaerodactylus townsendi]|uniref:Pleckstrin y-like domain A member 2 n=1 Tax=Sphaerodactylus townsendi TaxID=933632 RepID=A0ACB8G430_9SAUR|nr:pleckstrin homology-like domain family A member 2 [Sphaerodactylus townsendi]XP_048343010.1 pleckstrin homology-like domain family A member 2 [Sphaerodactylus townsendi]XP_048343011.1 pleckstrin homology-like domain family A member 2 [Sphaerodactylus townsendi]
MKGPGSSEVIREGELEKRSDSLFQLWKKKQVVLSADSLRLFSPEGGGRAKAKELRFGAIQKVDCVERTGKYVYFTIVTTDRKEIDFRCPGESCWNASITLALIDFQNKRAVQDFRSRQEAAEQQHHAAVAAAPPTRHRRLARAP